MKKTALLAAALLGISITPASAQQALSSGQPVSGSVAQGRAQCHELLTSRKIIAEAVKIVKRSGHRFIRRFTRTQ